ncbi:RsmB/NOP family class I SAM-dependent RNA methyltransferase [Paenibacillus ginsengarvi]|uniref:RNA methyltransferase n=1 Tax=Paenibacillus ginsengarvi TaxID=400777 RepID=A0A3B0CKI9_9BACL|nr:RsmB/NOP family class I SAM-dependent RNA methyltransferase [Paenibacillus ginsengarvi]RKN85054.1 RNA methyltransferase [Paenibacillus ginsengarvi]
MTELPQAFIGRIRDQLGEEAEAFLHSYDEARTYGLRLNPLKLDNHAGDEPIRERLNALFRLSPVPWCEEGYYYDETARPGKHPFHQAGLYYIQEPSAMSSAELLAPQPGDIVLDLAAAPGGKTTQIAAMMKGRGLLVTNEIHPARAKILSENVERMGIANAVVVCAAPDALARKFAGMFDKIMLDAPCSGEGMFRKDAEAVSEWSPDHVTMCAARQLDILNSAAVMLKPGGQLAYSTCTFNCEENENAIDSFLAGHPDFRLVRTERLWPHLVRGEGHFVALLSKKGNLETSRENDYAAANPKKERGGKSSGAADKTVREAMTLASGLLEDIVPGFTLPPGEPVLFGEQLYWLSAAPGCPLRPAHLDGLKILRPGLHLALLRKGRAEPSHSLAMAVRADQCRSVMRLDVNAPETEAYLRGETIVAGGEVSGWTLVTVEGYPLGWGKASGGQLKNHFPKGLRKQGG